jgi:hypothetical protein
MKTLILTAALLGSQASFAFGASLVCKAKNGDVLTWVPKYGELTVKNANGKVIESQDALVEGQGKRVSMTKVVTPIEYADEEPGYVLATIIDNAERVSVVMDGQVFNCLN